MKLIYELRNIESSNHPDFIEAINLYLANTKPELRTDSKEIAFWLDVCNARFEDPFYILGFYLNSKLIGFAELAYFVEEKFAIVDYIAIDEDFRERGAFHVFLGEIKQFIKSRHPEYHFIVGEVACYSGKEPSDEDRTLIRLLKTVHFGVVKCIYRSPRMTPFESSMGSVMMVYSQVKVKEIKKDAFLLIVKAIYYKYYLRWIGEFDSENEKIQYTREVTQLMVDIESKLKNKVMVEINGYPGSEINTNSQKKLKRNGTIRLFAIFFALVLTIIFYGVSFWYLKTHYDMDGGTVNSILLAACVTVIGGLYIYENRSHKISKTIEKFMDKV
jgi:hypothetical protein